ncbi:sulfate transporter family domain-containing protein [Trichoderma austrokoningii]
MDRVADKAGLAYYTPEEIAQTLAFLSGCILFFIGAFRLGWLLRIIPKAAMDAYGTAAALKVIIGQLPALFGLMGVSNAGPSFVILANVLRRLRFSTLDAAFGLPSVAVLTLVGYLCAVLAKRNPKKRQFWNLISTLRFLVVVGFSILASYLLCREHYGGPFQTVGPIESGFIRAHIPSLPRKDHIRNLCAELPAVVLLMVVSQAALVQKLAGSNAYAVNNSQELVALGFVNMFSPCVGGYLNMGSFSSSAVLSMAGSRSPLAGVFAAMIVAMALYLFMGAFAYTPLASLAGLVIYSMFTCLPRPKALYRDLRCSPVHSLVWAASLATGVAYSLEWSLYVGTILKWLIRFAPPVTGKKILIPYPGVFVHCFPGDVCYFNQSKHLAFLSRYIQENTVDKKPPIRLHAVILDFEGVKTVDFESAQGLSGLRHELDLLAGGQPTQWRCINVDNFWAKRSLAGAGFDVEAGDRNREEVVDTVINNAKMEDRQRGI